MNKFLFILSMFAFVNYTHFSACSGKKMTAAGPDTIKFLSSGIVTGAERLDAYLPLLAGKRVALLVNPTSRVGKKHLVDTLLSLKVNLVKIFSPEHGFRGLADAGELVSNDTDSATGLPIVSLHGKDRKPRSEAMRDVDIVIFDIQDVGVRFFTYISTMHYLMEACAENDKQLIVLDRPNPNGNYVDGPVLDMKFKSFLGMHPIPIVHGLTVGELATMINGEKWLDSGKTCRLNVIGLDHYSHKDKYTVPVKPSPNLPNGQSILLYPSLGLFEGTSVSLGRGTDFPFQVLGAPSKNNGDFVFTPRSIPGMAKSPLYEGVACYGSDLRKVSVKSELTLQYLIEFYNKAEDKSKFFTSAFDRHAGNAVLQEQIRAGWSEEKIKASWQPALEQYKVLRKKYLLYQDFN